MPIFLEKFVLPILATAVTSILIINPMKFDWKSRISLFVAIVAFGYFVSHQLHLRNEAIRRTTEVQSGQVSSESGRTSGPASTHGDNSPANTGDNNKFEYNNPPKK
jgi:hypothetical protein